VQEGLRVGRSGRRQREKTDLAQREGTEHACRSGCGELAAGHRATAAPAQTIEHARNP
jgi:hypothetical protein